jgi:cell division protein FtsB
MLMGTGSMMLLGVGAVWWGATRNPPLSSDTLSDISEQRRRIQDELDEKSRALRDEIKALTKERSELDLEMEGLKQNRATLHKELEGLTTRRAALDRWKRSDFVMVNPNSFAVGLRAHPNGQLEVVQRAEGLLQQDAVRWAKKEGHHPIDQNPALTRRLYDTVAPGEMVPASLADEIRRFWRPQQFVPVASGVAAPPFLVFQDAEQNQRRVAFFLGADNDQLRYRGVSPVDETVAISRIQVGTARMAEGEKILTALSDADFVDYCVLNAAHKLGSPDGKPSTVRVAIHLNVDALSEELKLSRSPDTRGTDELFEFYARLHEKPYPRDARKEPVRVLREAAMYVEDQLYQKLSKLGIPLVERQQIRAVIDEKNFGATLSAGRQAEITQLGATHMLFADIQSPQSGGRYHIAFRLTDVRRGETLWAETGERLTPKPNLQHRFLLSTGLLFLVKVKEKAIGRFRGLESPPILVPAQLGTQDPREHLVILENANDPEMVQYRSLFTSEIHELPRSCFDKIAPVMRDIDIPVSLQMRYAVWKLASRIMPPAGRVLHVEGDRATIAFSGHEKFQPQQKLYALRFSGGNQPKLRPVPTLLPTELTITEVMGSTILAVASDSGLPTLSAGASLQLDDLVVPQTSKPIGLAMIPPGWKEPGPRTFVQMQLKNPVAYNRLGQEAKIASLQIRDRLASGLRSLGVSVFTEFDQRTILTTGATHVAGGTIQPLELNRYRIESMVFPLNAMNVGLIRDPKISMAQLGEELARVEFDINQLSLK